jgi:hypothetical protein
MKKAAAHEPHLWRAQRLIWGFLIALLLGVFIARGYRVRASEASQFDKVKESRRGKIRTARERKKHLMFKQHRTGVTRNLWIQDPTGPRRQFFLEAKSAEVSTSITSKAHSLKEFFFKPQGCLQEELFWEVSSTGERVLPQGDRWVRETAPHTAVPERLYRHIVPAQRVRFFDAATAEWTPETNELIAKNAFFSVLKIQGHDLPASSNTGHVIAKGTAQSITFLFDKNGRQQVSCQGVKLHLNQGASK